VKLTAQQVKQAQPRKQPYPLTDGNGLILYVAVSGRKAWRFRYRLGERQEVITLGHHPKLTLTQARQRVCELREHVERGQSPAEDARRLKHRADPRTSVAEFGARWLKEVVAKVRKEPKVIERVLTRDIYPALGARPVALVTAAEVQTLIFARRDKGRPEAAAVIRHTLKRLFEYAQACGLVTENPTTATPLKFVVQHAARTRALSAAELKLFLTRLNNPGLNYRLCLTLKLILLTLCRKSELRLARWEHIDFARALWEVPAENSKTGIPHIVYLSTQAVECFAGLQRLAGRAEVVLPMKDALTVPMPPSSLNQQIRRVKWGIAHFTPHDLRRTGSTVLNEMGYNPDWIEKALNHSAKGIRGVYNRAQYAEQRRKMLQEWADFLGGLCE
jgi:integrase